MRWRISLYAAHSLSNRVRCSTHLAVRFSHPWSNSANGRYASETKIEVGKPIQGELKGGVTHTYPFSMDAGRFASLVVDQRGIDIAVLLFAPDGKKITEVDSPNGTKGPEAVAWRHAENK